MRRRSLLSGLALALAGAACSTPDVNSLGGMAKHSVDANGHVDAGKPDARIVDSGIRDASSIPDGSIYDAGKPDAQIVYDGGNEDAGSFDAGQPDASTP